MMDTNRRLSLEPVLRCPRCRRAWCGADWQVGHGFLTCWAEQRRVGGQRRERCGQRWWAMALSAGPVEPQIGDAFDELAPILMAAYGLPATLDAPMFWQLPLTSHEAHIHRQRPPLALFRALALLPFIAA